MGERKAAVLVVVVLAIALATPEPAAASGGGDIFPGLVNFLQAVVDALTGEVAKLLTILAIVVGGILWMVADSGTGMRKVAGGIIGAAIVIAAVNFADLMGFSGALL